MPGLVPTPPTASDSPDAIRELRPLGEYEWPSLPAEEAIHRVWARVQAIFQDEDADPFVADDQLERTTLEMLDRVAAPPACGPAVDEIARDVTRWQSDALASHLHVVVVPPCDENDVMGTFAQQYGHPTLTPPDRAALMAQPSAPVPSLDGDGLLVVPQLERWMLRHRNGLGAVRGLLAALYAQDRRVLVGCNSWAWAFLSKAVDANLLLPPPVTFAPFDADRLRDWFSDLSTAQATQSLAFRFPSSGQDVFSDDDASEGATYFRTLAAHSLGIPWVAWHQWRRSLFRDRAVAAGEADADGTAPQDAAPDHADRGTLFVGAFDSVILPGTHPQTALMVLQTLLIHGSLTAEEIRATVPLVGEPNLVPSLTASGFVETVDGAVRCRAAAYPAIRAGLLDAGFPVDTL